jgi:quercetin dioxygenase-like cupin family protein
MSVQRVFDSSKFLQPADGEPIRSVITQSADAVIVAWHVKPGQRISTHLHPAGQDTWTILSGSGEYCLDESGATMPVAAGDVIVAHAGEAHGVLNTGAVPLIFVSVVSPPEAGFQLV